MSLHDDTFAIRKALEKLNRTKARQEETLAATIGQIELFEDLLARPDSKPKTK